MSKRLNLHYADTDPRGQVLCPFRFSHFEFGKKQFGSVEGFLLSFRVPARDPKFIKVSMGTGVEAFRIAHKLPDPECILWEGRAVGFGTEAFRRVFTRMMRARFRRDLQAIAALGATKNLKFVHEAPYRGAPVSHVPIRLYCDLLEKFRDEIRAHPFKIGKAARD